MTDNDKDFEGEEGKKLMNYFKQVFFDQYTKNASAIKSAVQMAN